MDLRTIKQNTTWGEAANDINLNFSEVNDVIESDLLKTSLAKGLYPNLESLKSAYPAPEIGCWAYVGTSFPAYYYTWNGASWEKSEEMNQPDKIKLIGYIQSEYVSDPTKILY